MQTDYIAKREVKVPNRGPKALNSLLAKTQEGLSSGGGLDTVRLLHDSLAFLTEFFASFAVGALQTVGPYSTAVEQLLKQPPSLDRSERLLSQAFIDWKAHPHHPAYESLRETFFLSSRLQSSRFAPRRHTRWLGVEGRAIAGVERLTRFSRSIDQAVTGGDLGAAETFINTHTPVLWTWTDALETFFDVWNVDVVTKVEEGRLGLTGSASRSDVRLDLVPVDIMAGLKSRFASDGNGGVTLDGFNAPGSGGDSSESQEAAAPAPVDDAPAPAEPVATAESENMQLVFDPASGEYVAAAPQEDEGPPEPTPVAEQPVPVPTPEPVAAEPEPEPPVLTEEAAAIMASPINLTPDEPSVDMPAAPSSLELPPEESAEVPGPDGIPDAPLFAGPDTSEVPGPDEIPDLVLPASEPVAAAEVPLFATGTEEVAPIPAEPAAPLIDTPAVEPAPESGEVPLFAGPDSTVPATPVAVSPPFATAPADDATVEFTAPPSEESVEPVTPAVDAAVPGLDTTPGVELGTPVAPEVPTEESLDSATPVSQEVPAVVEPQPAVTEVPPPDFGEPLSEPEAGELLPGPDLAAPISEEPVSAPEVPDFAAATEPVSTVPDLGAPPVEPTAEVPTFAPPEEPIAEHIEQVTDAVGPAEALAPPPEPVAPPFAVTDNAEVATEAAAPAESVAVAPDFAAPVDPAAAVPDLTAPVDPAATTPDFAAPVETETEASGEVAAPSVEVSAPDFSTPTPESAEVPGLDATDPIASPPEFAAPATTTESVDPLAELVAPAPEVPVAEPVSPAVPQEPQAESGETSVAPDFAAAAAGIAAVATQLPDDNVEVSAPVAPEQAEIQSPDLAPVAPDVTDPLASMISAPEVGTPDLAAPELSVPAAPELIAPATPEAPDLAVPAASDLSTAAPVMPDFAAPAEPESVSPDGLPAPDFTAPAAPDFQAPQPPELAQPVAAMEESAEQHPPTMEVPLADLTAPSAPAEPEAQPEATVEVALPVAEAVAPEPADVSALEAPDFAAPEAPQPAEVPDFAAPEPPAPDAATVPGFDGPTPEAAAPDFIAPEVPVAEPADVPDLTAPEAAVNPEVATAESADVPDLTVSVPDAAGVPDFAAPAPEAVGVPEFTTPEAAVPEAAGVPEFTPPEAPAVEATGVPEFTPPEAPAEVAGVPEFTPPEAPTEVTGVPEFTPPEAPEATGVPDFAAPEVPGAEVAGVPAFTPPEPAPEPSSEPEPAAPESGEAAVPQFEAPADDMFAVKDDDMFSSPTDASAPLFPVDTGVAASPFVASEGEDFQSVELESGTQEARDMGAGAEEILEDAYEFSPEDGPAPPQWAGWSVDQREAVQEVCEFVVGQGERDTSPSFLQPIQAALQSGEQKIQVILNRCCGKTRLGQDLLSLESQSEAHIALLASWEKRQTDGHAGTELLRFYYELRRSKRSQRGQLALPEPQTLTALAKSADNDGFEQAFQRLLNQIGVLNRKPLLFILDEPPETVRKALTGNITGDLRFLSLVNPDESLQGLGVAVDLQGAWQVAASQLFGDAVANYQNLPGANLLRLAMASELLNADQQVPADLQQVEAAVLQSESVDSELVAALSLEESPTSLDDLDQWFLEADAVTETITTFPSLFELTKTRLSPVLGLAHPDVGALVQEQFAPVRSTVARKLLGWVVAQLERTNPEKYGGLQVREIVFRNFLRLYRFAKLADDPAILEWVLRNKELQRRRVALTSHLERPGSRYNLGEMLQLLVDLLNELVDGGECEDLKDELGWAHSNLALNQLKLGLLPQAGDNISVACELFEGLVNKEKLYEFRPALSTTHYRASRIFDACDDSSAATSYANSAVQGFVDLVEDRGRTELTPRLGIALAHRGGLFRDAGDPQAAKADLQRAAKLLENTDGAEPRETYSTLVDIQLELVELFQAEGDQESSLREAGKAVQLATVAVEEKNLDEFQPLLASCHAIRAKAYMKIGDNDRAFRDVAKSISLRNLSVDEGRMEQRFPLTKDLQLRAQISISRGADSDATRDLNRAIELLDSLLKEGRADASSQLLRCLRDRSQLSLRANQAEAGIADLQRALSLIGDSSEDGSQKLSILDNLLQAYLQTGRTDEALQVSQGLLTEYHTAQAWEPYSRVQLVRGEALERIGDLNQALESYNQAANLLGQLLAQGQTDELLGRVAEAYLGVGGVEMKMGRVSSSMAQVKRAIEVFNHLFQQRGKTTALPRMLKAYSLLASGNLTQERQAEAKQALQSGFDILNYMETNGGKNGIPTTKGLEKQKGELHRQRARALLTDGDVGNALNDTEEAIRAFLATRQQGQQNWKDELGRTWILRSQVLFALKDFGQAETSVQDAITHFEERLREGRYEFFSDLMRALGVRADNASKTGKIDQVLEEYNRMLSITGSVAKSGASIDHEGEMAKIFEKRAQVYRDQGLLNEAYADYENVIKLYRNLVAQGRGELAEELIRIYLDRGRMTVKAGHGQHAVNDLGEAVNVAKVLVGQGVATAVPKLAAALHERAEVFRSIGRAAEALQDLQGCIGFRSQLAQQDQSPELFGELGRAFLLQGSLLMAAGQAAPAAQSLDQANAIFTNLVEGQGLKEFSSELAQGLIQRVSLSNDKSDPALRQILIKSVDLVTAQAKDGKPVGKDFTIECLRTVVELLQREDFDTVGHLIDSVLSLVETVVADGKSEQDFVKLTDLLLAASAGLIDDRRTARRPHFLSLACVSCNREIQMFGKNSLPRLVYCLYELGQALERSKPPTVLNYVGSSFALLGELAVQQQTNEDFLRELKMMVSTWRSLPPQIPALANVSRHMLSQLLRLT